MCVNAKCGKLKRVRRETRFIEGGVTVNWVQTEGVSEGELIGRMRIKKWVNSESYNSSVFFCSLSWERKEESEKEFICCFSFIAFLLLLLLFPLSFPSLSLCACVCVGVQVWGQIWTQNMAAIAGRRQRLFLSLLENAWMIIVLSILLATSGYCHTTKSSVSEILIDYSSKCQEIFTDVRFNKSEIPVSPLSGRYPHHLFFNTLFFFTF